jgi:hypothetical protein
MCSRFRKLLRGITRSCDMMSVPCSPHEQEIIEHPHSCYVQGRSGTGYAHNFCTFYLTDLPGEQKDDDYALQNVRHGAFLAAKS